jgi:hypothetical protein
MTADTQSETSVPTRSREFDFLYEFPGMRSTGSFAIVFGVAGNRKSNVLRIRVKGHPTFWLCSDGERTCPHRIYLPEWAD